MAFKQTSAVAAGHQNPLTPGGPELVRSRFGQSIAVTDHVVGTKGVIGVLPAGTLPAHLYIRVPTALGAGFKASIGLADANGDISTAADDGGGAWVTDDTTGVAGGYIQMVPQFGMYQGRKCVVFCDEEGKLKGYPPNNRATELWAQSLGIQPFRLGDHLVGDIAILLGDDEFLASL